MTGAGQTQGGWVHTVFTVLGLLGGLTGVAALAGVLVQRRKLKADAADVLTDTALTLMTPLRERVAELEAEAAECRRRTTDARREAEAAWVEIADLRRVLSELTRRMGRWRAAILAPDATLERVRALVVAEPPTVNGPSPRE